MPGGGGGDLYYSAAGGGAPTPPRRRRKLQEEVPAVSSGDGDGGTTAAAAATRRSVADEQAAFHPDLLLSANKNVPSVDSGGGGRMMMILLSYPITKLLLFVVHLLYIIQWKNHRRRRRRRHRRLSTASSSNNLTYRRLVEKKQFYRWWTALLSQYHHHHHQNPAGAQNSSNNNMLSPESSSSSSSAAAAAPSPPDAAGGASIAMGNASDDEHTTHLQHGNRTWRQRVQNQMTEHVQRHVPSWIRESHHITRIRHAATWMYDRLVVQAGGPSVFLLLYNSHLLWSCRALEKLDDNDDNDRDSANIFYYLRLLVSVGMWATLLEVAVTAHLLRLLHNQQYDRRIIRRPDDDTTEASSLSYDSSAIVLLSPNNNDMDEYEQPALRRAQQLIRERTMGISPTLISTALLMIHRFEFPYVAVPVLPWFPISQWLKLHPDLCYWLCNILLYYISIWARPGERGTVWVAMVCGWLVGLMWKWLLSFSATVYWGNALLFLALLLTTLSWQARKSSSSLCTIGWNERGRSLVYDDTLNRYFESENIFEMTTNGGGSNDSDQEDEDDDDDDDRSESQQAFPTSDDEAIYGRLPSALLDDSDDDETNRTEWIPTTNTESQRPNQMRSRRNG